MVTLYFVVIHKEIKQYTLDCSETNKTFKSINGTVFGRNTFKKSEENKISEGYFYGSWFIYSTDKSKIKDMTEQLFNKAINYHNRIVNEHQKDIILLSVQFEDKESCNG